MPEAEIPCATCPSWARKEKKFTCNPDGCKDSRAGCKHTRHKYITETRSNKRGARK